MINFTMPALGADMDEGTLDEWLVQPGDTVTRGQVVAVVETTKAAVEVECWQEGTVGELLVAAGETVQVGTPLATLLTAGEQAPPAAEHPKVQVPAEPAAAPEAVPAAPAAPSVTPAPVAAPPGHRRWVSPLARREAASLGVDLEAVTGTGPQGSVTVDDVHRAAETVVTEPTSEPAPATKPKPKPKAAAGTAPKRAPKPARRSTPEPAGKSPSERAAKAAARAEAMRASIAAAMGRSKREIPHYYLSQDVMLDRSLAWLTERNAQRSILERVLPAVLQIKAVGLAAQRFSEFNGFWKDNAFQASSDVHVGVAISLRGGGLVAPAIHDVPGKKLDDLMSDLTDLVARARAGSLRSSEMSDPTITVTNLGDKGVDAVFGVIYPPQVALVGFGTPAQRVCAVDGGIRIGTIMQATLSADHRASDGHRGALFLAEIARLLQDPDALEE